MRWRTGAWALLATFLCVLWARPSGAREALTYGRLVALEPRGAPGESILAKVSKDRRASSRTVDGSEEMRPSQGRHLQPDGVWTVNEVTDRMSGQSHIEGFMIRRFKGSAEDGRVHVSAVCLEDEVLMRFMFRSDSNRKRGFRQYVPTDKRCVTSGGSEGGSFAGMWGGSFSSNTVCRYAGPHQIPWVEFRIKYEGHQPTNVSFENKYSNQVNVVFPDEFLRARSVLVELPLENGIDHIVELRPQEASFREFASRCGVRGLPAAPCAADGFCVNPFAPRATRKILEGSLSRDALIRRIEKHGLSSDRYGVEIAYILLASDACARVTPEMAATVPLREDGKEDLAALGAEYAPCSRAASGVDVSKEVHAEGRRHLLLTIQPAGQPSQWRRGAGFDVHVAFEPQQGDPPVGATDEAVLDAYAVISSRFPPAPKPKLEPRVRRCGVW